MTGHQEIFPGKASGFANADQAIAAFDRTVAEMSNGKLVLVKFHGNLCLPCQQYAPVFEQCLKETGADIPVLIVSLDSLREELPTEGRKFSEAVKGTIYFPDLQAYINGRLTGGIRLHEVIPEIAKKEGESLDEQGGVTESFPAAALATLTARFLKEQLSMPTAKSDTTVKLQTPLPG